MLPLRLYNADIATFLYLEYEHRDVDSEKVSKNIDSVVRWMNSRLALLFKDVTVNKAILLEFRKILQDMGAGPVASATFHLTETAGRDPQVRKNTLDLVEKRFKEVTTAWGNFFAGK